MQSRTETNSAMDEQADQELIHFYGLDATTGSYCQAPLNINELVNRFILGKPFIESREELANLNLRKHYEHGHVGLVKGNPLKPEEVGWGIVFAKDAPPQLKDALSDLMNWRRCRASPGRYYELTYIHNEQKIAFLKRYGASPGPVDPEKMPYYILLVGDPNSIPYRFQHLLDVEYAVGRVDFGTDWECYKNYAKSVVRNEQADAARPKRTLKFFAPSIVDDKATEKSVRYLVTPLAERLRQEIGDWQIETIIGDAATKERLRNLMGGGETPALLMAASHGLAFPSGDARQLTQQGALICQEWPGPKAWHGQPLRDEFFFSGIDLAADAKLDGTIVFLFACYGGGTSQFNQYYRNEQLERPNQIAPAAFTAYLPQQMLGRATGGALAVIAHVERANTYSFTWGQNPVTGEINSQTQGFEAALRDIMQGVPIGHALDYFNSRYSDLMTELTELRDDLAGGIVVPDHQLAWLWSAAIDSRNYVVLGDPAVRLSAGT